MSNTNQACNRRLPKFRLREKLTMNFVARHLDKFIRLILSLLHIGLKNDVMRLNADRYSLAEIDDITIRSVDPDPLS